MRELPLDHRQLPRGEHQRSRAHRRHVGRERGDDGRQCDAELAEPLGRGGGHARDVIASYAGPMAVDPDGLLPAISAKARLHVVTGKGGTGKTTAAAALALALAGT